MKTRRDLLQFGVGAAALSALPLSIQRALAAPASVQTGTIKDVEHIVILMQENRSFDHYFGARSGYWSDAKALATGARQSPTAPK
jgi:phospholipase C